MDVETPLARTTITNLKMTCYFKNAYDCDGVSQEIGDRLLLETAKRGSTDDVREVLERGMMKDTMSIDQTTGTNWRPQQLFDGRSAIHVAIHNGKADVVKLLLEYGASTTVVDSYGLCPLHAAAAYKDSKDIVTLLLDHGADIDRLADDGATMHHRSGT